jgi:mevalonate kinase
MAFENDEEFEIIPTSPLRKLEQRIKKIEGTTSTAETQRLIEQIIELIKSNQRIVDDVIKSNADLRDELSKVPPKIDDLISNINGFVQLLKTTATEEAVSDVSKDVMQPLVDKMGEMIDQSKKSVEVNQAALTSLGIIDKRLKRIYLQFANTYRRQ